MKYLLILSLFLVGCASLQEVSEYKRGCLDVLEKVLQYNIYTKQTREDMADYDRITNETLCSLLDDEHSTKEQQKRERNLNKK